MEGGEITLSCPARVRTQRAFRVGDDLGVDRPSIYTTAFIWPIIVPART